MSLPDEDDDVIPPGIICAWAGLYADVPDGWAVLDGVQASPDLRTFYLRGTGSGVAAGNLGYPSNHNHTFNDGGHRHGITAGTDFHLGPPATGQTDDTDAAGITQTVNHLPPSWGLWWIVKL